jgi:alpha-galactosidase
VCCKVNTLLDGTDVFTRWLEIENTGDAPMAVGHLSPMTGGMEVTDHWQRYVEKDASLYRVGYMEDTICCDEGNFKWHDLPNAEYGVSGVYRRDRHRHPMFILENKGTGMCYICQFGWSGGYRFLFDLDSDLGVFREEARLSFRIDMDCRQPVKLLAPKEVLTTPAVHIGAMFGGLDEAVNEMNIHIRKTVMKPQVYGRGCWIEGTIACDVVMTREQTLDYIDATADLGAELFFLDAGWFCLPDTSETWSRQVGKWIPDQNRYPNGLEEIRQHCIKRGMLFGLWMEPERIGYDCEMVKEHPEWLIPEKKKRQGSSGMSYGLNLNVPEAARWMEKEIVCVIENYQCDFFRLDFNVNHRITADGSRKGNYFESNYVNYYQAINGIFERIRRRFPNVILENCASGGGRTDIGFLENFCHTWVTDWPIAPRSFSIENGMTMALPPEYINRVISGQNCHTMASLAFQMRQLLFITPTFGAFNPTGSLKNPRQIEFIKRNIELYKSFIRPFLPNSRIFHHTPEFGYIEPQGFGVLELDSAEGDRGILGIFQLSNPSSDSIVIKLRGIDISKNYTVTFDNHGESCMISGYQLVNDGITVYLKGALTSELVYFKAV